MVKHSVNIAILLISFSSIKPNVKKYRSRIVFNQIIKVNVYSVTKIIFIVLRRKVALKLSINNE